MAVTEEAHDVMFEVDPIKFLVVVGERVRAGHVAVVSATILVFIVEDGGRKGGGIEGKEIISGGRMVL